MMTKTFVTTSLCLVMSAFPTLAQDTEFTVTGFMGGLFQPIDTLPSPWNELEISDPWSVTVCFDPAAGDTDPSEDVGIYPDAITSARLTMGGFAVEGDLTQPSRIRVADDEFVFIVINDSVWFEFELTNGFSVKVELTDVGGLSPLALDSDELPDCSTLSNFMFARWFLTSPDVQPTVFDFVSFEPYECGACIQPECFLVIGPAPGSEPFVAIGHEFTTQVGAIEQSFPVFMEDIPEFVIWEAPPSMRASVHGLGSAGGGAQQPLGGTSAGHGKGHLLPPEDDPLPQVFFAQVLMWNPQVFPGNPEQYTHGLAVTVMPNGRVFTAPYGTSDGGLMLWAETDWNDQGQKVLRLPFSIPGF